MYPKDINKNMPYLYLLGGFIFTVLVDIGIIFLGRYLTELLDEGIYRYVGYLISAVSLIILILNIVPFYSGALLDGFVIRVIYNKDNRRAYLEYLSNLHQMTSSDGKLVVYKEDKKSAEVIKPLLRGRDIKRYCYDYNNLYLLFIPWHFPLNKDNTIIGASLKAEEEFKNNYKAIYNHLLNFKEQLQKRNKAETGIRYEWYALQRCAASYYEDFEKDKIIYQEICQEASYALDECKSFIGNTGYIMTSKKYNLKVLLSLLNSKLYWWFFKNNNVILGDSAIRMLGMYIEVLPIIEVDEKIEKDIIQLVDKIIIAKKENKDTSEIEGEVDRIVYSLYGLSEEEIKIIEG